MSRAAYLKSYHANMSNDKKLVRLIYRQLHGLSRPDLIKKNLDSQYQKHRLARLIYADLIRIGFRDIEIKRQSDNRRKRKYGYFNDASALTYELQREIKWLEKRL